MEKTNFVVCDTNILIEVLDRNNHQIIEALVEIGHESLCISSITFSELIAGAFDKAHLKKLKLDLDKFILLPIDFEIDQLHRALVYQYALSHKLSIQDALIAATAIAYDIELYTLNKKDFRFISNLRLFVEP
jgi:tRNA(fMet)-specific endonuclease VapC